MEIIALFFVPALLIWGYLVGPKLTPLSCGLGVIVVGAVFGAEFFNVKIGPIPATLDRLLWGAFGIWIVIHRLSAKNRQLISLTPVDFLLISFAVVITVSTFTHDWRRSDNLPLGRLLFFQLLPLSFFWLGRLTPFRNRDLFGFAVIGLGFGVYLALTGIAEKSGIHSLVFPSYIVTNDNYEFFGRARGPFINPVGNGIVLIFCLSCIGLIWSRIPQSGRTILLGVFLLICFGVYCTMTRSVWLGLLISLIVIIWFSFPYATRGLLMTSLPLACILFLFVLGPYINQFKRDQYVSAEEMSQSVGLRPMLFSVAMEMHQEKPVFGHGYGQYKKISEPYHRNDRWDHPLQTVHPYLQHNLFLAYLVELGIVGMSLLVAILGCFLFNACVLVTDSTLKPGFRMLCLSALIVNLNMIINGLFHDVSLIVVVGSLYFYINGLAYSVRDRRFLELAEVDEQSSEENESAGALAS